MYCLDISILGKHFDDYLKCFLLKSLFGDLYLEKNRLVWVIRLSVKCASHITGAICLHKKYVYSLQSNPKPQMIVTHCLWHLGRLPP